MFAVNIDNLLFLLLIAAAGLFQLLSKTLSKSKKKSDKTPEPTAPKISPPIRRMPTESDADRIRKFLEALGQPPTSPPPPPVVPRTDVPLRPLAPVQPPVVMPRTWASSRERQTKPDTKRKRTSPLAQPTTVAEIVPPPVPAPFEVQKASLTLELDQQPVAEASVDTAIADTQAVAKGADFKSDIATWLASKATLRQAIILREIFGPPRSLQTLDFL
jgi:hypothetical protein